MSEENAPRLFGTNGIRGIPNDDLTPQFALEIGKAIGTFVKGKIALAMDNRLSGPMLLNAVNAGILSTGSETVNVGILPTPGIQYYCKSRKIFGVMITASHNPPQFNGIKCIDPDGTELHRSKEIEIEKLYNKKEFSISSWENMGRSGVDDSAFELYINAVLERVNINAIRKRRFRVAFDAGNGAAYLTTPEILTRMRCTLTTLNANPDGLFTSRPSEPKPQNLKNLVALMKSGDFDIGIAHDGDADRVVFIDEQGNFIDGDTALALFSKEFLKKGDIVVTPVSSSNAIEIVAKDNGSKVVRTMVGAPIVSRAMIENGALIGGEENGGFIYGKHQYCRDGAMAVALMLDLLAREKKPLSEVVSRVPKFYIMRESTKYDGNWQEVSGKIKEHFKNWTFDYTDGIKAINGDDWVLIRPSGTEPIVRIFGQSENLERAYHLADDVKVLIMELHHS
ncbi:MAG: phosphoglucosamine mutase [Thermoplasmataceae archaeon]